MAGLALQLAAHLLTVVMWSRWQALITFQNLGPQDPLVERLVATHWIRTVLVAAYALVLRWATAHVVLGQRAHA